MNLSRYFHELQDGYLSEIEVASTAKATTCSIAACATSARASPPWSR